MFRSTRSKMFGLLIAAVIFTVAVVGCQPRYSAAPMQNYGAPLAVTPAAGVAAPGVAAPAVVAVPSGHSGGGFFESFTGSLAGSTIGSMIGNSFGRRDSGHSGYSRPHYDSPQHYSAPRPSYRSPVTTTSPAFRSGSSYAGSGSSYKAPTSSFTNSRGITSSVTRSPSGRSSFSVSRRR